MGALPAAHANGMDLITRTVVAPALVADWLPAIDSLVERLSAGGSGGCGLRAPRADSAAMSTSK